MPTRQIPKAVATAAGVAGSPVACSGVEAKHTAAASPGSRHPGTATAEVMSAEVPEAEAEAGAVLRTSRASGRNRTTIRAQKHGRSSSRTTGHRLDREPSTEHTQVTGDCWTPPIGVLRPSTRDQTHMTTAALHRAGRRALVMTGPATGARTGGAMTAAAENAGVARGVIAVVGRRLPMYPAANGRVPRSLADQPAQIDTSFCLLDSSSLSWDPVFRVHPLPLLLIQQLQCVP